MRYSFNGTIITQGYYDENTGYWFKDLKELNVLYDMVDIEAMIEDGQIFWTECED